MIFDVKRVEITESTNADLKAEARAGAPIGRVIVADRQSGGRGRMDRAFSSAEGGLYMSLLLPLDNPSYAGLVTTFAAVAVARAVESLFELEVGIKWVNDLLVDGKKICGILAEGVPTEYGYRVVLGIGVNLQNSLPKELSDIAATLFELSGKKMTPSSLVDAILSEFESFPQLNYNDILAEYRHRCVVIGKNITVIPHCAPCFQAKALDVLDDGSLWVERLDNGEKTKVFSGEVSTKLLRSEK